jgi:hypothetical protein
MNEGTNVMIVIPFSTLMFFHCQTSSLKTTVEKPDQVYIGKHSGKSQSNNKNSKINFQSKFG